MNPLSFEAAALMSAFLMKKLEGRVERVAVAGSVRRQVETVNNIDLVLIPKLDPQREGHFMPFMVKGQMVRMLNGEGSPERVIKFAEMLFRPVPAESTELLYVLETIINKEQLNPEGIRVTIAIATEENWGHILMFRTGSRAFNDYLANRALDRGLVWSPFSNTADAPDGLFDPSTKAVIASKTEEEMFKALKLKFVDPKDRERVK